MLPGRAVAGVRCGTAAAEPGGPAGVRQALAHAAGLPLRRLFVRAAPRHLRRAAAHLRRRAQPRLRPPARRVPDAARGVRDGARRSGRPRAAGRGRRGPDATAGAVGGAGRGRLAMGRPAAHRAGGTVRATASPVRPAVTGIRQAAGEQPRPDLPGWPASTRRRPPTPGTRCPPTLCASPRSWRRSTRPTSASESCCTCSPRARTSTATTRSRCRSPTTRSTSRSGCPTRTGSTRSGGCARTCSRSR